MFSLLTSVTIIYVWKRIYDRYKSKAFLGFSHKHKEVAYMHAEQGCLDHYVRLIKLRMKEARTRQHLVRLQHSRAVTLSTARKS